MGIEPASQREKADCCFCAQSDVERTSIYDAGEREISSDVAWKPPMHDTIQSYDAGLRWVLKTDGRHNMWKDDDIITDNRDLSKAPVVPCDCFAEAPRCSVASRTDSYRAGRRADSA